MTKHIITPAAPKRNECEACHLGLDEIVKAEDPVTDSWTAWENDTERCKETDPPTPMSVENRPGIVALLENIKLGGNVSDARLWAAAMAALEELKKANGNPSD